MGLFPEEGLVIRLDSMQLLRCLKLAWSGIQRGAQRILPEIYLQYINVQSN